jgi:cyclase
MLKKRIIIVLTFNNGVLFRTKNFKPDYRYTKNFIDLWSVDEIILIDVSKKKDHKKFLNIVNFFKENCFVPVTVGGGVKDMKYADNIFKNGSEKILLGSDSLNNKNLIREISEKYGSQALVQSVDIKKINKHYVVMKNSGEIATDYSLIKIIKSFIKFGAGEILINNIDNDGGLLGYDLKLIKKISKEIDSPLLALGGAGNWHHLLELFKKTNISAACTQNIYHFTEESVNSAKRFLLANNINIRK